MAQKVSLSVVIPCFNEAGRLPVKFPAAYHYFQKLAPSFEVILVNDGSVDKTDQVIRRLADQYREVKIVSYSQNRGKGYALKKGVAEARGEIIAFMDADFAISVSESDKFIKAIKQGADLAIGNRRSPQSQKLNSPKVLRIVLGKALSYINNTFLDIGGIKDSQCGFKFFKGAVAKKLFGQLTIYRWLFDMELLMLAKKESFKITRLPVAWESTADSKVSLKKDFWPVGKDLLTIYLKFYSWKLHAFLLLALLMMLTAPFLLNPQSLVSRNGDYTDLVMPDYYLFKDAVWQHGQIPLWNPTLFSGIPEIANPQSPVTYLPNYLSLVLPVDLSVVLLVILHALLGGLFTFVLARRIFGWSVLSAVAASLTYMLSPFFWGKVAVGHLSQSFAIFLLPGILYYGTGLLKRFSRRNFLLLSGFLALQYLNYPTLWYFTVLFGGFVFGAAVLTEKKKLASFAAVPLAALLSLGMILPVLLAQLSAGPLITRSALNFSDLAIPLWSLRRFLASVIIPSGFLGDSETEVWLYPSMVAGAISLYGWGKLSRGYKIIGAAVITVVLLVTLGDRTPLFGVLTQYLPGFSYLRVATRDWFIVVAVLALLCGWGLEKMHGRLRVIAAGLLFLDLLVFSAWRLWTVPPVMTAQINPQLRQLLSADQYRYYCTSRCLSAGVTMPLGINTADGYHLMILKDYREAISQAGGFMPPKYTGNIPSFDDREAQPSAAGLGKFAIKWVISDHELLDRQFLKVKEVEGFTLYENKAALPRIRFADAPQNPVEVLVDTPNYLKVKTSGQPGLLVVADSFYPGWEAWVDGVVYPVVKHDGWGRALKLPQGNHIVEMEFKPFFRLPEINLL